MKDIILSLINFFRILERHGNIEIGQYLVISHFESVLCMGITEAIFKKSENIPKSKDKEKKYDK